MNAYALSGTAVLGTIAVARLAHNVKRMFERRCPKCGSLRVSREYFMEPTLSVSWSSDIHRRYDTYTLYACKNKQCGNAWFKTDTRFLSVAALDWRRIFHPGHFDTNGPVYAKLWELGALPGSRPAPKLFVLTVSHTSRKMVIHPPLAPEPPPVAHPKIGGHSPDMQEKR